MDGLIALALAKKYTDSVGQSIISAGFRVQVEQDRSILNRQGQEKVLYLLPKASSNLSNDDGYDEFVYANNKWEWVGKTDIDLSQYALKEDVGDLDDLPTTDKSSLVAAVSETFTSVSNGKAIVASAITDKGVQTSSDATFSEMAQNIENIPTGGGILIPKTITENGVYNAADDNADGYSSVDVNVPEKDPNETLTDLLGNRIQYFKSNKICLIPVGYYAGDTAYYRNLVFFSTRRAGESSSTTYLQGGTFRNAEFAKYINVGHIAQIQQGNTFSGCIRLKCLIFLNSNIVLLPNANAFTYSAISMGTGYIWVFDSLKSDYQNSTNWSVYVSQIKGFSEAPVYSDSVTYEIGDVCQYNSRFYGYCKSDLTSSTGNPPTGTTEDNEYWEYCADIEVI